MVEQQTLSTEGASLRIEGISKDFPAADNPELRIPALDSVSLTIAAGQLVSLIGPSGCGKSTLLRLIAGLDTPGSGELWVGSEKITGPSAQRGLVFQDPNLFPWLTVRGNFEAGLVARGLHQNKRHEVEEFMRVVGLESFANAYPHHLSGGMAQRVALGRALINHPKVLLLDEPLGALDAFTRMRMQDEVLRLWQARRTTMVLVTHDIDEAIYMSDRIIIMTARPGRIEREIEIQLPRPRERNSSEFLSIRSDILEHLHFSGRTASDGFEDKPGNRNQLGIKSEANERSGTTRDRTANDAPGELFSVKSSQPLDAQVIVIGGGPAGSTVGAYLARAGVDHMILDQAVHPRPHVGESLVCSTTRIFQEIDFLPVMERERFVHKHGAVWTHWADNRERIIRFREMPELGLSQDYTYHVDRSRFDQLLLQHASRQGSRILEGARVEKVIFDEHGKACGVRVKKDGTESLLRCKLVIDASGRKTVLGSQLRLRTHDALFDQFAVHNWFKGVDRGPAETADYIHIHVLSLPRAWVWLIPIDSTTTSVGIVTKGMDFPKGNESVQDFFDRQIASHPLLAQRMANATPLHEFSREGNYSYVMERFAGDGWLLVGDAARFVDPIFSSGVSVAMESAKRASEAVIRALQREDLSAASFADYERAIRAGVDIWREFILLYYQLPPLFFDLISRAEGRLQITQLLQGDVYERSSVPILEQMRKMIQTVRKDRSHAWHSFLSADLLGAASA